MLPQDKLAAAIVGDWLELPELIPSIGTTQTIAENMIGGALAGRPGMSGNAMGLFLRCNLLECFQLKRLVTSMPSRWVHWFAGSDENDRILVEKEKRDSEAWLEMIESEPFNRHLAWIDREINRPFQIGSQNEMISAAVRSNTFKEIKEEIRKATEQAKRLLSAESEPNA